ncbi:MAG: hypothetical protein PHQ11_00785 [Paludibacter sp.]|nr:hypothetical protein [Paludibacter sp.]MDD4198030.1 hypothetical protein [Paludibacter sp.]MDD4427005.1 hypothetical protein [Paludibacter sp.]
MNFFKLHKPLVYKYKPIYYDPKKEAQKERMKHLEQEEKQGNPDAKGAYQPTILHRGSFREMADRNRNSKHAQVRQSNIRLIIIILILFLIAYFLMR